MPATLQAPEQLVQALCLRIAKLQKQAFGKSSEKIEREIAQLELTLEDLLVAVAEQSGGPIKEDEPAETDNPVAEPRPRRRPRVSDAAPRERRELDPGPCCPDCGGDLRVVAEDVSELLDLVAARMKVIQIARVKKSCRRCERMVQPAAPSRPIPGSMAGPGLLAQILVSKFDDHLPLYRQHEIFARMGADIPDSTLLGWCGRAMKVLTPVIERIEAEVMAAPILHADDTPIRVLERSRRDRGFGKGVKQGRVWAYVSDQRPWAGTAPPGVVYRFSRTGKGSIPSTTCKTAVASCKRTPMPASTRSTPRARMAAANSARRPAGRICAATWTGSASSTTSNAKSPASPPNCERPRARRTPDLWLMPLTGC
ncbi:Transposase [Paracoccus pantotrophus]|nr:Transposase [Paracoccus pantotrophus]